MQKPLHYGGFAFNTKKPYCTARVFVMSGVEWQWWDMTTNWLRHYQFHTIYHSLGQLVVMQEATSLSRQQEAILSLVYWLRNMSLPGNDPSNCLATWGTEEAKEMQREICSAMSLLFPMQVFLSVCLHQAWICMQVMRYNKTVCTWMHANKKICSKWYY